MLTAIPPTRKSKNYGKYIDQTGRIDCGLILAAIQIQEDVSKGFCRLTELCKKTSTDRDELLRQAAAGEISLYVFHPENKSTQIPVEEIDLTPYLVPFPDGELMNESGEVQLKVRGVTFCDPVSLDELRLALFRTDNAGLPGFAKLSLSEAQELNSNKNTFCHTSRFHGLYLEVLRPDDPLNETIAMEVTFENVCVFEKNFIETLRPEYLKLAIRCWSELFGQTTVDGGNRKASDIIRYWLSNSEKTKPLILTSDEQELLTTTITPTEFRNGGAHIKKYVNLSGENEPNNLLCSKELIDAINRWDEILLKNDWKICSSTIEANLNGVPKLLRKRLELLFSHN